MIQSVLLRNVVLVKVQRHSFSTITIRRTTCSSTMREDQRNVSSFSLVHMRYRKSIQTLSINVKHLKDTEMSMNNWSLQSILMQEKYSIEYHSLKHANDFVLLFVFFFFITKKIDQVWVALWFLFLIQIMGHRTKKKEKLRNILIFWLIPWRRQSAHSSLRTMFLFSTFNWSIDSDYLDE